MTPKKGVGFFFFLYTCKRRGDDEDVERASRREGTNRFRVAPVCSRGTTIELSAWTSAALVPRRRQCENNWRAFSQGCAVLSSDPVRCLKQTFWFRLPTNRFNTCAVSRAVYGYQGFQVLIMDFVLSVRMYIICSVVICINVRYSDNEINQQHVKRSITIGTHAESLNINRQDSMPHR
jgi:hypothetical protein